MKFNLFPKLNPWILGITGGVIIMAASSKAFDWPVPTKTAAAKAAASVAVNDAPLSRESKMTTSYSGAVKKAAPAVVNISTTKIVRQNAQRFNDPMFRFFFGDDFGGMQRNRPQKERSLGSGVIVTKDGYLVTNHHVVEGADEIKVSLAGSKKEYEAKVVGKDPRTDIAVLKIDTKEAPFVTLGDSDKVEVGDVVLAIGSPFGLSQTVTMGIVSAVGRGNLGIEDYEDFIQTDAAINVGNSGGALIDVEGRVIGINTAILANRGGGNQGVGFAVPINMARGIMDRLLKDGKVDRGFMGLLPQDLTPALARKFSVPEGKGVLVGEVTEKAAADEAGIKPGDIITEFNGKSVIDARQFRLLVADTAPGSSVKVKLLRESGEKMVEKTLTVVLKTRPAEAGEEGGSSAETPDDVLDGVVVSDIDANARAQLRLPASIRGAVVVEVDQTSAAFEAGLRSGDVIQEINRRPIRSAEDAVNATKNVKDKELLLRVYSRGVSRYIVVDERKSK